MLFWTSQLSKLRKIILQLVCRKTLLCLDYSVFNTIQPLLLVKKHSAMWVDHHMVDKDWRLPLKQATVRATAERPVRCGDEQHRRTPRSSTFTFPFTIYTFDFTFNSGTSHLQKFSDDSSILGCIIEDREDQYRGVVEASSDGPRRTTSSDSSSTSAKPRSWWWTSDGAGSPQAPSPSTGLKRDGGHVQVPWSTHKQ